MCGIAGIYDKKGTPSGVLPKISAILRHRGPDDEGFWLKTKETTAHFRGNDTIDSLKDLKHIEDHSQPFELALIHRRLSIIDKSEMGHQPMSDTDNSLTIVFNGEIYNFKEIKADLINKGYQFKSHSDTELILYAYKEWGEKCVERFEGMWAFCIYDDKNELLFLSRDRFGIKPLYYHHNKEQFCFASEVKVFSQIPNLKLEVDTDNLISYTIHGATQKPFDNLYKNIVDLPPAHNLVVDLRSNKLSLSRYYQLKIDDKLKSRSFDDNLVAFEELFDVVVEKHLLADVEVGACLSGGLDSSAIVTSVSKKNRPINTFTAAYKEKHIDESEYAKLISDQFSGVTPHYTYPKAEQFVKDINDLIYFQDFPIGSTSIFAQWEVMKLANQNNIKVLLDGQGADETLGGYYNFAGIYLIELLKKFNLSKFVHEYHALKTNFTPNINNAIGRASYYYLPQSLQQKIRAKNRLSYNFIAPSELNSIKNDIPLRGGKTFEEHSTISLDYNVYELLRYEDRNSMAFSIESRVPFLDHNLVEFIVSLPNDQKLKDGWTKYILRKYLDNKVDPKITWRKDKKGFITPQQEWKNQLILHLKNDLRELELPAFLNKQYIETLSETELTDPTQLSEFWRIYSIIKWFNIFKLSC